MKNRDYRMSVLKKQIREKENRGVKILEWRLQSQEQVEYIRNVLHKRVEPFLYEIRTKHFYEIRKIGSTLLKDLHYANKRGKMYIVRELAMNEKQLLDEWGIKYKPVKYRIYIRRKDL